MYTSKKIENMDVYRLLNVSRNATSVEIKQAYRKLALKFHPDLNPTRRTEAEEHFKKITVAYQTLLEHKKQTESVDNSSSYTGMPPGFGNSTEGHAHWNPKPSHQNNPNNPNAKKKYDAEAAQKAYHANQRAQQQGSEPYINPDHFNVNMWRAGHYGGEDISKISSDNLKYKTTWASSGGKHQQYYARRNEAKRQQEAADAAKDEQVRQAYDAGHNLRKKREERLKTERTSTTVGSSKDGDGDGDGNNSNAKCTIS